MTYLTLNSGAAEFDRKVAALEDAIRGLGRDVILAGDFNARTVESGMSKTKKRGRTLLEMTARLDMTVANVGNVTTYRRPG